jgi:hypothetical protein
MHNGGMKNQTVGESQLLLLRCNRCTHVINNLVISVVTAYIDVSVNNNVFLIREYQRHDNYSHKRNRINYMKGIDLIRYRIVKVIETVELVVPGWPLRVQLVMTPYWQNLYCHAHLQGPTATTDSVFL